MNWGFLKLSCPRNGVSTNREAPIPNKNETEITWAHESSVRRRCGRELGGRTRWYPAGGAGPPLPRNRGVPNTLRAVEG